MARPFELRAHVRAAVRVVDPRQVAGGLLQDRHLLLVRPAVGGHPQQHRLLQPALGHPLVQLVEQGLPDRLGGGSSNRGRLIVEIWPVAGSSAVTAGPLPRSSQRAACQRLPGRSRDWARPPCP